MGTFGLQIYGAVAQGCVPVNGIGSVDQVMAKQ